MNDDALDELRRKFIADLELEAEKAKATPRQKRVWEWLRWVYQTPKAKADRSNVEPISESDAKWLDEALSRLDDLDPPEVT